MNKSLLPDFLSERTLRLRRNHLIICAILMYLNFSGASISAINVFVKVENQMPGANGFALFIVYMYTGIMFYRRAVIEYGAREYIENSFMDSWGEAVRKFAEAKTYEIKYDDILQEIDIDKEGESHKSISPRKVAAKIRENIINDTVVNAKHLGKNISDTMFLYTKRFDIGIPLVLTALTLLSFYIGRLSAY